jgi:hypothetical protein
MDFIVGLPNTSQRYDSIWVIVDRLTKTAHFLPVHTTYNAKKYAEIYLDQIVHLHGIPKTIISDHGAQLVCCSFLGATSTNSWNQVNSKLRISSANRWTNRKDKPNLRRYASSLCNPVQQALGQMLSSSGILLQ